MMDIHPILTLPYLKYCSIVTKWKVVRTPPKSDGSPFPNTTFLIRTKTI